MEETRISARAQTFNRFCPHLKFFKKELLAMNEINTDVVKRMATAPNLLKCEDGANDTGTWEEVTKNP